MGMTRSQLQILKNQCLIESNDKAMVIIGLGLANNLIHNVDFDKSATEVLEK